MIVNNLLEPTSVVGYHQDNIVKNLFIQFLNEHTLEIGKLIPLGQR